MRYYPVFLDIADKPVVVVGGGNIALQKMDGLLDAGAKVTVISPDLNERMTELRDAGRFMHLKRAYEPGDIVGHELVFVATDDHEENRRIWKEGRERHIWVNAVDDIPNCDFIMPGIVRQGELVIAISTSANSPAMARKVREDIQEFLTPADADLLDLAGEVRRELKEAGVGVKNCDHCSRNNNDVWNAALDGDVKRMVKEGDRAGAKARILNLLLAPSGQLGAIEALSK